MSNFLSRWTSRRSKETYSESYEQLADDEAEGSSGNLPSMSTAHPRSVIGVFSMVCLVRKGKYEKSFAYAAKEHRREDRKYPPARILTKTGKSSWRDDYSWDKDATINQAWDWMGVTDNVEEYSAAKSQAVRFQVSLDWSVFGTVIESETSRKGKRRRIASERRSIVHDNIVDRDFTEWIEERRGEGDVLPQLITLMDDEDLFKDLKRKYRRYEARLRAPSEE